MTLSITGIERAPEAPEDTGEAASGALAIYSLLMQASPERRPALSKTVLELSQIVCEQEASAVPRVSIQIFKLLSSQLPEKRNRFARHALECVQTICGVIPFSAESLPRRA